MEHKEPHETETSYISLYSLDLPTANVKVKNTLDCSAPVKAP